MAALYLAFVALLAAGCASEGPVRPLMMPAPPGEAVRARFGRVAVVSGRFVPQIEILGPAKGAGEGARRGAGMGAAGSVGAGVGSAHPFGVIGGLLLSPVVAAGGAVTGALMARPSEQVEGEYQQLASALAQRDMQGCLRDRTAASATRWTGKTIEILQERGPEAIDRAADYGTVDGANPFTVLEVVVEKIAVAGWGVRSPRTSVFVVARTRLLRAGDSAEIYAQRIAFYSPERRWQEWTAGRALQDELDRACDLLAERIAEEVFALYVPPTWPRR